MESKIEVSEYFDSYEIDFKAIISKVKQFEKGATLNSQKGRTLREVKKSLNNFNKEDLVGLEAILNDLQDADKCVRKSILVPKPVHSTLIKTHSSGKWKWR